MRKRGVTAATGHGALLLGLPVSVRGSGETSLFRCLGVLRGIVDGLSESVLASHVVLSSVLVETLREERQRRGGGPSVRVRSTAHGIAVLPASSPPLERTFLLVVVRKVCMHFLHCLSIAFALASSCEPPPFFSLAFLSRFIAALAPFPMFA